MNSLFEPVYFEQNTLRWDYGIRIEHDFKGYHHWHQCCEFVYVHEGRGSVVVHQQTYEIRRGMLFFFQPYQLHQVYADVAPEHPYVRSIFYADPLRIASQLQAFPGRHARFLALWQGTQRAHAYDLGEEAWSMERALRQFDTAKRMGKGEDMEELILLLLQLVNLLPDVMAYEQAEESGGQQEDRTGTGSGVRTGTVAEARIAGDAGRWVRRPVRYSETVMRWIEEHYHEEIKLRQLAALTHLSPNYLCRVFRQETGGSITDYLTARRIKQACRLLETTDLAVERIGIEAGFPNGSYFIQLFKNVMGITPLKYRQSRLSRADKERR